MAGVKFDDDALGFSRMNNLRAVVRVIAPRLSFDSFGITGRFHFTRSPMRTYHTLVGMDSTHPEREDSLFPVILFAFSPDGRSVEHLIYNTQSPGDRIVGNHKVQQIALIQHFAYLPLQIIQFP